MIHYVPRWPAVIVSSIILTLATVTIGNFTSGFGFPLPWKTGGCPPPGIAISTSCLLAIGFDWLRFGLDVLFYTVIGYAILMAIAKYRARQIPSFRNR